MNRFNTRLGSARGQADLLAESINIVQINLGYLCNQACAHCHLDASPNRTEVMSWETMVKILEQLKKINCQLVDLTGGAPELNPHFRPFVKKLVEAQKTVQVRTNLTALLETGNEDLPSFFKDHKIQLVASMPCYLQENVDAQRGMGTYDASIRVLEQLNKVGFGRDPELQLNLVYNPGGPALPPAQEALEQDYKKQLKETWGVEFTNLLTITNVPIGGFLSQLKQNREDQHYRDLLEKSFNPQTLDSLMCRHQICIDYDGTLYDCDFNIALSLPLATTDQHIENAQLGELSSRKIVTGEHCFACTAGIGSSCCGALVEP